MSQQRIETRLRRRLSYSTWESIIQDIEVIEPKYSLLGSIFSLGYADRVRREAIERAFRLAGAPPPVAVDVGSGPGDSVRQLAGHGAGFIVAIEPSSALVHKSCNGLETLCNPVQAVAEHLPIRNKAATVASSFYAVRDYEDTLRGLKELTRVSDIVAIGDIFVPSNPLKKMMVKTWVCGIVPPLAALLYLVKGARYWGICRSLKGWCSVESMASLISALSNGFNIEYRSYVLGGLGYIVAWKDYSGTNRGKRHKVWIKTCRGSSEEENPRGDNSNQGCRKSC